MAVVVVAALASGCGGDDHAATGGFGAGADLSDEVLDDGAEGFGAGTEAGGDDDPERISSDPDGDLADFPIPSPAGALDASVAEIDGVRVAQIWYAVDRYDELADAYEGWFLDNGLIANPVDRVVGQISMGGQNDSGSYLATVVSTADQVFVQLTVE